MAQASGATLQRAWMEKMGMLHRLPVELPEAGSPLAPPAINWKEIATLTIGFGHGIAVTPLHVVAGTAAIANGGVYMGPTVLAGNPDAPREGRRVMQVGTSDIMRRLMRLVVTDGYGKAAEVPGYFVGGKTGTAEKISHKGYNHNSRVAAFMSVFPMNAPRYAVYMMLDEPHATKATYGFATAGWVAAPAAGRVIARIAPMMGLLPETENVAAINAELAQPLEPGRPAGAPGPRQPPPAPAPVPAGRRRRWPRAPPLGPAAARPAATPRATCGAMRAPPAPRWRCRSEPRLRCADLMRAVPGLAAGSWHAASALDFAGVSADSRRMQRRIPVRRPARGAGGRARFIAEAVARGAAAVLAPEGTDWPQACRRGRCCSMPSRGARLAEIAAALAGAQPATVVAVTGTNGKTSTVEFLRQIWALAGHPAASLGTLGLRAPGFAPGPGLTTPDPEALAATLARSRGRGCSTPPWKPPRTGSTSSGWTGCGWRPGRSPTSRATIWTITAPPINTATPSCGCSPSCCRRARRRWPARPSIR